MAGKIKALYFAEGIETANPAQIAPVPVGDIYSGTSTSSQTVISLGFSVKVSASVFFDLYIDGLRFVEGASKDYTFTSVDVDGYSSEITLTSGIAAGLYIIGIYRYGLGSALSNPMITAEDLIVGGASGAATRLPVGTEGQILKVVSGAVEWANQTAGFVNPMTTAGDIIKGGTSGTAERLAIGAENKVLTSKSGAPSWEVAQLDDFKGSATIANNQTSAADVTGALLDNSKSYFAKIDYSIDRRYTGDIILSSVLTNIIDGSKFSTYGIAFCPIMYSHSGGLHFIGGSFADYGGTSGRSRLIAFDGSGNLDTTFLSAAVDGAKFNSGISVITGHADGDLLIGGNFTNYAGTTGRNRLIKISSAGVVDTTFTGNSSDSAKIGGQLYGVVQLADGKVAICGNFTNYGGTSGKSYLVVLNSDGTEHSTFNTAITNNINGIVYSVCEIASGKLLVMGAFTAYAGTVNRSYAIVLNISDGTVDTSLTGAISDSATKFNNHVYAGIKTSDNGFIVGGIFTNYGGTTNRSRLVKFKSDGSLDQNFNNLAVDGAIFNNQVSSIYQTYLNRVVILGNFLYATQPYYGRYGVAILEKNGNEPRDIATTFTYGFRFASGGFWSYETPCNKVFLCANATAIDGITGRNYHVAHAEDGTFVEKPYREGTVYAYYNAGTSAWEISKDVYQGESRGVTLSITSAGQLQYISNKRTGTATTNTIKYFVKYL